MQSEDTWMELHVLHRHGWSIAALAREFGFNWRTARRYASQAATPLSGPRQAGRAHGRAAGPRRAPSRGLSRPAGDGAAARAPRGLRLCRQLYQPAAPDRRARPARGRARDPLRDGPGIQTQGDWTDCGIWPLGDGSRRAARLRGHPGLRPDARVPLRHRQDEAHHPARHRALRRRPGWRDRGVPDRPRHRADERQPCRRLAHLRPRVARHRGAAGHPAACLPSVPGQDQGQGRADHPGGQGGLPGLARGQVFPERPTLAWYDAQAGAGPPRWSPPAATGPRSGSSARPGPRNGRC